MPPDFDDFTRRVMGLEGDQEEARWPGSSRAAGAPDRPAQGTGRPEGPGQASSGPSGRPARRFAGCRRSAEDWNSSGRRRAQAGAQGLPT